MNSNVKVVGVWLAVAASLFIGIQPARCDEKPGPFDDVPQGHWAYDSWSIICRKMGSPMFDDFHSRTIKGKRALTRYEFGVVIQRLQYQLRQVGKAGFQERISLLEKAVSKEPREVAVPTEVVGEGSPLAFAVHSLAEERNLRVVLKELERLCNEFSEIIGMLGGKVPAMLEELEVLSAHSKTISQGLNDLAERFPLPITPKPMRCE